MFFRFFVLYQNGMISTYEVELENMDDEIDKLCQDDFVLNFKYRRVNADGTYFQY